MTRSPSRPIGPGHHLRTECRACRGVDLPLIVALGPTPLANRFLAGPEAFAEEPWYPLDLYRCRTCGLVQLLDVVDPEILFRDYVYVSGTSRTMTEHFSAYAEDITRRLALEPTDLVVEVASNDGSLLQHFRDRGVRTLGVEPARNIAARARAEGIETVEEFFGRETAAGLRTSYGPARAILANNVLAHVDDTEGFLAGAVTLLAPDGMVVFEVPYLEEFVHRLEFDTVYHEHLCYFAVHPLLHLCTAVGLSVVHVEHVPVHGGSIRVMAVHRDQASHHAPEVRDLARAEVDAGLLSEARWSAFATAVHEAREALRGMLLSLRAGGKRVAAYGAPAKGNTLLNYCALGPDLVSFTVDRNPLKAGFYTPGAHLPVRPYAGALTLDPPDVLLILAWNFAEEIMAQPQEKQFRAAGGRFLLPLPSPRLV